MSPQNVSIAALMAHSGVKFGTSGARGLAHDMTDRVCFAYTLAFIDWLKESGQISTGDDIAIAGDFRPSTPRIMRAVAAAISDAGMEPIHCGFIPTPALANYAIAQGIASIMVTGSHIPDNRNGIKFYKPAGEILKADEQALSQRCVSLPEEQFDDTGQLITSAPLPDICETARQQYIQRYLSVFPATTLNGLRIGIYEHSSVARDILADIFIALGADIVRLGRAESFIPVDTEAIRAEDIRLAKQWTRKHRLDCIISTDGDGDRPLISDEHGNWLRGDIAGILCARYLGITSIALPVSCNTAVEKCGWFTHIRRTRIGSPFVVEAMQQALHHGDFPVAGYEANGGFLTASDITLNGHVLPALPTRDALIVPLAILALAQQISSSITELCQHLPARFTFSERLKDFPTEISSARLKPLYGTDGQGSILVAENIFASYFGPVAAMDTMDGIRMTFANGDIVHLRPSGNAPELRCYTESSTPSQAWKLNQQCLDILKVWNSDSV